MSLRSLLALAALLACFVPASAHATLFYFVVDLNGANEVTNDGVPNQGDPDGTGTATLIIDDSTAPFTISWNISVADIDLPVILAHIHEAPATTNGPVRVDFNAQLTGAGLADADLAGVLANPSNYYVNIHTNAFRAGAIRGQIPEPGTVLLLGGGVGLLACRRDRARRS
jgi:hypothetical protein